MRVGMNRNLLLLWLTGALACSAPGHAQVHPGPPLVAEDPFLGDAPPEPPGRAVELHLRIIRHGVTPSPDLLEKQLRSAERIFSQCAGLKVRLKILDELNGPPTQLQDRLIAVGGGKQSVSEEFFDFFSPWIESRPAGTIDVHLVDHLNPYTREEHRNGQHIVEVLLGRAFNAWNINRLYSDPRATPPEPLSHYAGDTVILAVETLEAVEGRRNLIRDRRAGSLDEPRYLEVSISHEYSLLAHELGHILLEEQSGEEAFQDHRCPELGTYCPPDHLMKPGSYVNKVFYDGPEFRQVIGHSPLPRIEERQCEVLRAHSKLHQLDQREASASPALALATSASSTKPAPHEKGISAR